MNIYVCQHLFVKILILFASFKREIDRPLCMCREGGGPGIAKLGELKISVLLRWVEMGV